MLVCPQCQFENPTANNFCQKCGTSLTQNTCLECGSSVPFDQANCQDCGAIAGVMWFAVISPDLPPTSALSSGSSEDPKIDPKLSLPTGLNGYLDLHQRYQLLAPLPAADALGEQEIHVLDCQPFQLSLLETLILPTHEDAETAAEDESRSRSSDAEDWSDSMAALAVPAIAQPYITLRNQFDYAMPAIHNAWQWHGQAIVLLEDRSHYPLLIDRWCSDATSLPILQMLQWLYEMVELWQGLAVWNSQQSLLVISNLCVEEEDDVLCLRRLYQNPTDVTLTLQDLGQVWQLLFAESQKTTVESINHLMGDLGAGLLTSVEALKARIEAIAQSLQPDGLPSHIESLSPVNTMMPSNLDSHDTEFYRDTEPNAVDMGSFAAPNHFDPALADEPDRPENPSLDFSFESDDMPTIVLPMQLFSLEEVGRTDVGRQRDHNEDYFGIETQVSKLESPSGKTVHARNLYILCDGMGGHAGGEVASALAVDTIRKFFQERWLDEPLSGKGASLLPDVATLTEAVLLANKTIYDVNQQNARSGSGRMGTTLVMMLIQDTEVAIAHVGDSRLYRYTRKRGLQQITSDHEVGQREIQRGVDPEVAYSRPDAYQLTQALGPRDEHFVRPDVQFFELNEDMLLMLCSDGLSDNDCLEKHWESHIKPLISSQTNLDAGVSELIEMANRYNGHDNITAIAVRAKVRPSLEHLR